MSSPLDEALLWEANNGTEDDVSAVKTPISTPCKKQPSIRRKALPQQSSTRPDERNLRPLQVIDQNRPDLPLRPNHQRPLAIHSSPSLPTRRMLGPRPLPTVPNPKSIEAIHDQSRNKENCASQCQSTVTTNFCENPVYREKQHELDQKYKANGDFRQALSINQVEEPLQSHNSGAGRFESLQEQKVSITLIRRYGGEQNNVSTVDTDGTLEIQSSGYQKFTHHTDTQAKDTGSGSEQQRNFPPFRSYIKHGPHSSTFDASEILHAASAKSPPSMNSKKRSFQRYSHYLSDRTDDSTNHERNHARDDRQFNFTTPWATQCAFSSGFAGRSLRCKTVPSNGSDIVTISELRFNLPSSQALRSPPKDPRVREQGQHNQASRLWKHKSSSSVNTDRPLELLKDSLKGQDHDRIDLSLGQEHAGGGLGGKQAKLGKLIIQPEGLQMLDLLVAANISMWWKVYDKLV